MADILLKQRERLLVIAGPTAVGKSALAVSLALSLDGEIISADNMQLYRGMDIGTAKIGKEEMQGVPHHMIDCADPTDAYDVARYAEEVRALLPGIYAKNRLPILCGGSGFYLQAVCKGIEFTEEARDPALRLQLEETAAVRGPAYLHGLLAEKDPASAALIHQNNLKRVIRALEYIETSGETISGHNETERKKGSFYDCLFFVISMDRKLLYHKIDQRVLSMFEEGLINEVEALRRSGLRRDDTAMQGIGYKEVFDYLEGLIDLNECIRLIQRNTRHYAKRQMTWFRNRTDARFLERKESDSTEILRDRILEEIAEKGWI